ncbi:MAG: carboxypeptidase regulatory-like domain-containing protein [Solirubrobacterales bacterium]|nr:carboxypeptidase regulatory-like domain-containing protein [Solirubrobacterales bacterium]
MRMRTWRLLAALLGVLGVAALVPGLALADAPITGQVTDAVSGNGISGVNINLYNASTGMAIGEGTTSASGTYSLGTWPSGTYQLQFVDSDGRYPQEWYNGKQSQSQATSVTVGSSAVVVNQALQPDQVTGQVTDQASGRAISGIDVELLTQAAKVVQTTTTDGNGNYTFSAFPAGTYEALFNPGQVSGNYSSSYYGGNSPTTFQVGEGQTVSAVNGQLVTDGAITGQLTDQATDQAISGIEVDLLSETGAKLTQTTTAGDGTYRFIVIPPGTYEVAFNPGGANNNYNSAYYGGASATKFAVSDGQTTQNINGQLFTGGLITGTVTDSTHHGIAGAYVQITDVNSGNNYYPTTGADGTYAVDGLPTSTYDVYYGPGGGQNYVYQYYAGASNAAAEQPVTVTAGQATSHIDASLATGATLSGTVTDAVTHAPVTGANVYVYTYGGNYPDHLNSNRATTDAHGQWSIQGLATGTYEVEFTAYGTNYASQYYNDVTGQDPPTPITVVQGTTASGIDAALTMGGQISGTVTNGITNNPAGGVSVLAYDQGGDEVSSTSTDQAGNYTLAGLTPSSSYRVAFYPNSGSSLANAFYKTGATLTAATPVAVTEGQTTTGIDETLGAGGSISGVVTAAATGYPIGSAYVQLTDDNGDPVYSSRYGRSTEADGTYDFTNLPPGSYKVEFSSVGALAFQFWHGASTVATANSVTVTAGQNTANIDAALAPGGTLKGRVTDAVTGAGAADVDVDVVDAKGNFLAFGMSDPNGNYEIPGIAPGSFYLEFFPRYGSSESNYPAQFYGAVATLAGSTPVTITAGATMTGLDIALSPTPGIPLPVTATGQGTTPTTTTTTTTPTMTTPTGQAAQVTPGPPSLFGGSLSGLAKNKPVLKFRLASGSNGAHKLRSFKVKLPTGLSFVAAQLGKGVKVTGGGKVTEKLTQGQLMVTLGTAARTVTVSISPPALKVAGQLAARAARKTAGTLRVIVTVTPVNSGGRALSFTVKNPT